MTIIRILHKIIAGSGIAENSSNISLWSYNAHFSTLWGSCLVLEDNCHRQQTVIIVWDSTPEDNTTFPVNTAKYLTPLDWAISAKLHNQKLSVLIIDLNPTQHKISPTYNLLSIINHSKVNWLKILQASDLLSINDLGLYVEELQQAGLATCENVTIIAREVKFNFTSTEGDYRHSITNLIGPLILMKKKGLQNSGPHRPALLKLLTALGLVSHKTELPKITPPQSISAITNTKFILLDDQWMHGWADWLNFVFGNTEHAISEHGNVPLILGVNYASGNSLHVLSNPCNLLDRCEETLINNETDLWISGPDGKEMVFLDLRLFAQEPKNELKFIRRIIHIISNNSSRFISNIDEEFETIKLRESEIDTISKWCKEIEDSSCEYKDAVKRETFFSALTLLPRVLSLIDYTLPIIIFSSTGRREIVEKLKPYKNVITLFEKPRYFNEIHIDIEYEARNRLFLAMNHALKILRVRELVRKCENSLIADSPFAGQLTDSKHIEIYIDETGDAGNPDFYVGGLVFGYPDYATVKAVHDALTQKGCYWYTFDMSDRQHLSKRPNKQNEQYQGAKANVNWNYGTVLKNLEQICSDHNVVIFAFRITDDLQEYTSRHFPVKHSASDSRYINLLTLSLEILMHEVVPCAVNCNDNVTVSTFAATRKQHIVLDNNLSWDNEVETAKDYFGFYNIPGKVITEFVTVGEDIVSTVVKAIVNINDDIPDNISLHHARAVRLHYGVNSADNKQGWRKYRNQHYYADQSVSLISSHYYEKFYDKGFDLYIDSNIKSMLYCARYLRHKNYVKAVSEFITHNARSEDKLSRHVDCQIHKALPSIDSKAFYDLASEIHITNNDIVTVKECSGKKIICENCYGEIIIISSSQNKNPTIYPEQGTKIEVELYLKDNKLFGRRAREVPQGEECRGS